jgi:hypothetical protein
VQRQKEARWTGYQFMLIFLNTIAIYFAYGFAQYYNPEFGFFDVEFSLFALLFTNFLKIICYTPLEKATIPTELDNMEIAEDIIQSSINSP